ncbi:unnamed protein product [Ilex paraguariensis]|uniref:Trichome birefringence-like N-terminal domain-containing protein n=1 Tax=Ilex paraguariensis TaxID=185542 RepID=A0ABC8TKH2_9AQUA
MGVSSLSYKPPPSLQNSVLSVSGSCKKSQTPPTDMPDAIKYAPINSGTLISDLKSHFSHLRTKRTVACAYGCVFAFIAFTAFLAFSPSSNSSSPWFTNIFSSSSSTSSSSIFSEESYRSHFSSIISRFFPNSTQTHNSTIQTSQTNINRSRNDSFQPPKLKTEPDIGKNQTQNKDLHDRFEVLKPNQSTIEAPKSSNTTFQSPNLNREGSIAKNQSQVKEPRDKVEVLKPNLSTIVAPKSPAAANKTAKLESDSSSERKNVSGNGEKGIGKKDNSSNFTSSLLRNQSNGSNSGVSVKQRSENLVESLMNCNLFDGYWVRDDSYPLYKPGSCSLIDEQFNCFLNGRPDKNYEKFKWKPKGCTLPRYVAKLLLFFLFKLNFSMFFFLAEKFLFKHSLKWVLL